jgi:hypothetical protein
MLTFVGEHAARGLHDHHALYGEYLTKLARVTDHALGSQGHPSDGALGLWQSAAWIIYSHGTSEGDLASLVDIERMLSSALSPLAVRRVLDQVIERTSWHGRDTVEFIHYSFYEYLVAREVYDRIAGNLMPDGIVEVLSSDLPREIRHFLTGQLRTTGDANFRGALLSSYASARYIFDLPERSRLRACAMLIYLISRTNDSCAEWLRAQLVNEQDLFLRHAMLWSMCHVGSDWALREFFTALEADPDMRSVCRGWLLYYYGDLLRDAGPPYRDDTPVSNSSVLTRRRLMSLFRQEDYPRAVTPQRRFIDLYTFLDILGTRSVTATGADKLTLTTAIKSLHSSGLPSDLLSRLAQLAPWAEISTLSADLR